ncbi:TadE-like protein [Chlamydia trachomatis]|nr:TadE-like protein [Chlamydia trachomatis]
MSTDVEVGRGICPSPRGIERKLRWPCQRLWKRGLEKVRFSWCVRGDTHFRHFHARVAEGAKRTRDGAKRTQRSRDETGSVTVELAIGCVAIALMLALVLGVASTVLARQSLCHSASEAARAAMMGVANPTQVGATALGSLAHKGASVSIVENGEWVEARATYSGHAISGLTIGDNTCTIKAKKDSLVP